MVKYLDKLVQPSYTLFTLIKPLALHKAIDSIAILSMTKLASNACHFDLEIHNANIEQLPHLITTSADQGLFNYGEE